MKFATLVWKNALRNKRRSVLTILSLAASLFLLTTLRTVMLELQYAPSGPSSELRVITRHAVSLTNTLPVSYGNQIRAVPGVRDAMPFDWFGGIYIDERNFFAQFAVDQDKQFIINPELVMPDEQKQEFQKVRNTAMAGDQLFKRYGWKLGDRITLKGTIYPVDLELILAGRFTCPTNQPVEQNLFFHWDYLDELVGRPGNAGTFAIMANTKDDVPKVIAAVDGMYRNSPAPTKTETEKAFQLSFGNMMGNVQFLVTSISTVVVFTILLVTAATMSMSIRERTGEFGILKSLGFSRGLIVGLLVCESMMIALVSWLLGCVGGRYVLALADLQAMTGGFLPILRVRMESLILGLILAMIVGLLAAGVPAWRASRLSIAEAMRHIG